MSRTDILNKLNNFKAYDERETEALAITIKFIENNPQCFDRETSQGHLTGSAWIVNKERTHALLTHHKKLGIWIQLGGHCDGDSDVWNVASNEAWEESGLKSINPTSGGKGISKNIFDLDAHIIPAHKDIPEYMNHDIRFLFEADMNETIRFPDRESHEVKWLTFKEIEEYSPGNTVIRMAAKTLVK